MRYCIAVTILAGDTPGAIRSLLSALSGYVLGRDADETGTFSRYVLAFGGTPVTFTNPKGDQQEIEVTGLIAFNSDVSSTIKSRIGELTLTAPALVRQIVFNPPLTRDEMLARMHTELGAELGCEKDWTTQPGDDVTTGVTSGATLDARFTAV